jgi:predicted  nucleic acid-binding Zn-ribbon protein
VYVCVYCRKDLQSISEEKTAASEWLEDEQDELQRRRDELEREWRHLRQQREHFEREKAAAERNLINKRKWLDRCKL